jgi:hypothetical protein
VINQVHALAKQNNMPCDFRIHKLGLQEWRMTKLRMLGWEIRQTSTISMKTTLSSTNATKWIATKLKDQPEAKRKQQHQQ